MAKPKSPTPKPDPSSEAPWALTILGDLYITHTYKTYKLTGTKEILSTEVWFRASLDGNDPLVARFSTPFTDLARAYVAAYNQRSLVCNASLSFPPAPTASSAPSTPANLPAATSASPPSPSPDDDRPEPATYDRSWHTALEGSKNQPSTPERD